MYIPNRLEIHQNYPPKGLSKYTEVGIFVLKIYHAGNPAQTLVDKNQIVTILKLPTALSSQSATRKFDYCMLGKTLS
jgi:hypothetical protein